MTTPIACRCGVDEPELFDLTCGLDDNHRCAELIIVTCEKCGRAVQAPTEEEAVEMWNRAMGQFRP